MLLSGILARERWDIHTRMPSHIMFNHYRGSNCAKEDDDRDHGPFLICEADMLFLLS